MGSYSDSGYLPFCILDSLPTFPLLLSIFATSEPKSRVTNNKQISGSVTHDGKNASVPVMDL